MAIYTGQTATVNAPVEKVYERMADFSSYEEQLNSLPADIRAKIGDVSFSADAITIQAQPVGEIKLQVVERVAPERVVMSAENSPVPMHLTVSLAPTAEGKTSLTPSIDVEVPAMLKPFVAPKMQQAADQFGTMLANLLGAGL